MKKITYPRRLNFNLSKPVGIMMDALANRIAEDRGTPNRQAVFEEAIREKYERTFATFTEKESLQKAS